MSDERSDVVSRREPDEERRATRRGMTSDELLPANGKRNLIAFCGLYCGACSFRVAAQENDRRHLRDMPARYDAYKDVPMDVCPGCRQDSRDGQCAIRDCARKHGLTDCGQCPDFPCPRIRSFNDDGVPHHAESISNLTRLTETGEEAWLREQEQRWTCACGARLSWYLKECRCGNKQNK